jgi:hypothetical protein
MTVLTGLWLYWRFTDGLDPTLLASTGGHIFGTGGVLGLVAAIIAGSVVGKNMKRAVAMLGRIEKAAPEERAALAAQVGQYRQKAFIGSRIVAVLLILTTVLMALGHYV